jgi:hypothetical protein
MTRRRLAPPDNLGIAAHEFLYNRSVASTSETAKDQARDQIKGWLTLKNAAGAMPNGREDENGHRYLDFDEPLTINDVTYSGIQAQRKVVATIDLEETERLLREKDPTGKLYDRVFKRVVERRFDEDELFVLNQLGVISDDELDALGTEHVSYSLLPVKA